MTEFVSNHGCEGIGPEDTQAGTFSEHGIGGVPRLELYFRPALMSV